MIKKIISSGIISLIVLGMFIFPTQQVDASSYQCTITIDANKHDFNNPALLSDGCEGSFIAGYYNEQGFHIIGDVTRLVSNGEIIYLSMGNSVKVTTIPLKEKPKPKPEPKPEPKPQPKPEPKPAKPKQKTEPKPKTESKPQPKQPKSKSSKSNSSKPKSESNNNNSKTNTQTNTDQKSSSTSKETTIKSSSKTKSNSTNDTTSKNKTKDTKNKNDTKQKPDKLTIAELKDRNAEVIKIGNKYYAVYKNDDGIEIRQEITENQAKLLGFEEEKEKQDEKPDIKEANIDNKDNENKDKSSGKKGIVASLLGLLALGTGGSIYYYKRKKD